MANIFALRDSSLNAFLHSDVGAEPNGTSLTILSLLARLGKDPWEEASAWSLKSKDAAIRSLTDSISQMPPNQQAFDNAHLTASRLVALLPKQPVSAEAGTMPRAMTAMPKANLLVFVYFFLFIALNFWLSAAPKPDAAGMAAMGPVAALTK